MTDVRFPAAAVERAFLQTSEIGRPYAALPFEAVWEVEQRYGGDLLAPNRCLDRYDEPALAVTLVCLLDADHTGAHGYEGAVGRYVL